MKTESGGKNQNMKNETGKLSDALRKNNILLKNVYTFQLRDRRIKVVFSDNPNAQTIENALVKIVTKRIV